MRPDAARDRDGKAAAPGRINAPAISPLIGNGGEKLMDQEPMGGVDLDHLEAGLRGAPCGLAEGSDHPFDVFLAHGGRHRPALGVGKRRGCNCGPRAFATRSFIFG